MIEFKREKNVSQNSHSGEKLSEMEGLEVIELSREMSSKWKIVQGKLRRRGVLHHLEEFRDVV